MPDREDRNRPPLALAIYWSHQITTIGFEMAIPAAAGYWLDQKWGTEPWLLILGSVLGFTVAMYHLLKLVPNGANSHRPSAPRDDGQSQ